MLTHPNIGFLITSLLQDVNRLVAIYAFLAVYNPLEIFSGANSNVDERKSFVPEQSPLSEDFVGQSTPMDRSFETNEDGEPFLDASRVEIAEELQKQQNERLERLWKHQSEQNEKIFEQLDASMTRQNR